MRHRHWLFDAGTLTITVTRKVFAATVIRPIVRAVLGAVDLTDLVKDHLDVDAIVARVDLDAIVVRIDIKGLARQVIEAIDLPRIMRESTGAVASETVQGVRAECERADDAVDRVVDRVLRRRPVRP